MPPPFLLPLEAISLLKASRLGGRESGGTPPGSIWTRNPGKLQRQQSSKKNSDQPTFYNQTLDQKALVLAIDEHIDNPLAQSQSIRHRQKA